MLPELVQGHLCIGRDRRHVAGVVVSVVCDVVAALVAPDGLVGLAVLARLWGCPGVKHRCHGQGLRLLGEVELG